MESKGSGHPPPPKGPRVHYVALHVKLRCRCHELWLDDGVT